MLSVWRNVPLRRLQLAALLSGTSGFGYGTALFVWAFQAGGAGSVGLAGMVVLAPAAILAPFAALVGDRVRRDRALGALAASRALLLGLTALAMGLRTPLPLVLALAALAGVPTRLYYPVQTALVPSLARSEPELVAANSLGSALENVAILAGPSVAGALLVVASPCAVVALAGCMSVAVSFLTFDLGDSAVAGTPLRKRGAAELLRGVATIAHDRTLALVISVYSAQTLLFAALSVVLVKLAIDGLALGPGGVGLLNGTVGAGGVLGGIVALALGTRLWLGSNLRVGTIVWGLPLVLIAFVPTLLPVLALLVVVGAGNVVVDITSFTLIQQAAPDDVRARVFGALEGAAITSGALGALLGGFLVEAIGTSATLLGIGLVLQVQALALWRPLGRLGASAATVSAVPRIAPEPA
jgi:MFS family permease